MDDSLILVVDDTDASRFAKVAIVRRAGFRVVEAATAAEALEVARRDKPDLVLLDINLPDASGFEVCRRLKEDTSNLPAVQVLQLSSTAITDADRVRGLTGGADAYLTEPVDWPVLQATIKALLRVRAAETRLSEALLRERQARLEAERANQFKDDFLATLSHELRTPLSSMVGWIWQLRHGTGDETTRRRAIEGLERSTATQLRLIDDLLDVSRIAKGKIELELGPVDLDAVIEAAVESVQTAVRTKHIIVNVDIVPLRLLGDGARLQQVIVNLLTNAIKFSPTDSRIGVELTVDGGEAVIRVRDQGHGIDPALLPHIFDQFRQGESGFDRRHGGLGLGLSIVRTLVAMHGGTVQAESEGRGLGALFTVRLPIRPPSERAQPRVSESAGVLAGLRVLVVDNEEDSRDYLSALLRSVGAVVATAGSGAEALAQAKAEHPALIVSDIGMPEQDGLQLLSALRAHGIDTPAVAVTAFSAPDEQRRIVAAGYEACFVKPVDAATLLAGIGAISSKGGLSRPAPGPGN
jgi:signal transduction histidine kinase